MEAEDKKEDRFVDLASVARPRLAGTQQIVGHAGTQPTVAHQSVAVVIESEKMAVVLALDVPLLHVCPAKVQIFWRKESHVDLAP